MPQRGRSKRVAARQAQLGQRKKRGSRVQTEVPLDISSPPVTEIPVGDQGTTTALEPPRPTATPRPFLSRQPASTPTVYSYIGPEIKRIATLASVIVAALTVLTIVLR